MFDICDELLIDDVHETIIRFCLLKNIGMNRNQVNNIKNLIEKYLSEYSEVGLWKICDFYSRDYDNIEFVKYNYTHDENGEKYEDRCELAQYDYEDQIIGFNHIRLANVEWDNLWIIKRVEALQKEISKQKSKYESAMERGKKAGLDVDAILKIINKGNVFKAQEHEIEFDDFKYEYFDVALIRALEETVFLKRIVIHEVGHAIAHQYNIKDDIEICMLFENFKDGFEDIDEFIAECFMASELTNQIPLANRVRERINCLTR